MATRTIWLLVTEQKGVVEGWTEKDRPSAEKAMIATEGYGLPTTLFRLSLVGGKIFAKAITPKWKEARGVNAK